MTARFEIVAAKKAEEIRATPFAKGRPLNPPTRALLDGEVIQLPHRKNIGTMAALKKRGLRRRTRSDGNSGTYVWAEPLP